ncbi:hypothetical protein Ae201684P_000491 [Aphanomyces euteiches]|uniref:Uncharacterized protein n=1 Tax=Aphanomyces euteiches TaxID=100861 RepID=A0A6G0W8C7_9STRA|nr:hypothetical protein Ae201684_017937 [Aphanomyces euteiches]KAH9087079.1 hypothetical protein Ae201684P_000491 [Aphanomyces euteiches]KAH9135384.1 hypothetical protein AeRB84_019189 [Aphanomyces euteiches]
MPTTASSSFDPSAVETVCAFGYVKFPAHDESFHVKLEMTVDTLPIRISIEGNKSTLQWECIVTNIQANKPHEAEYAVPSDAVVNALMDALRSLNNSSNGHGDIDYCKLELRSSEDGNMELVVNLTLFKRVQVLYLFKLARQSIKHIEIVKAKVRDLECLVDNLEAKMRDLETLDRSFDKLNGFCAHSTAQTASQV